MLKDIPLKDRIIFALDVPDVGDAMEWVRRIGTEVGFFKVGLELFLAGWWPVVDEIVDQGHKVMLDLKFFDIPQTVKRAVAQLEGHGVTYTTIHGNDPIIQAAVADQHQVKILAVTVLTSFDQSDLYEMGLTGTVDELVLNRAQKALKLGCDGVVASAKEVARLRTRLGNDFIVVTPGIRPAGGNGAVDDDQRRVSTALEAMRNGADHLVIGRPIRNSPDPLATIAAIKEEIVKGLELRGGK